MYPERIGHRYARDTPKTYLIIYIFYFLEFWTREGPVRDTCGTCFRKRETHRGGLE